MVCVRSIQALRTGYSVTSPIMRDKRKAETGLIQCASRTSRRRFEKPKARASPGLRLGRRHGKPSVPQIRLANHIGGRFYSSPRLCALAALSIQRSRRFIDLNKNTLEERRYELITAFNTMAHVPNVRQTISEMRCA
jgi:hypothetical protein